MTPYQPQGTVYGTLLNFSREFALWAPRMHEAPYLAPPRAPVLYIKTANTFAPSGQAVALPAHSPQAAVGAGLGLVVGDFKPFDPSPLVHGTDDAINSGAFSLPITQVVLLNDLSLPHSSYYRPPIKFKNLDGFLGVGQPVDLPEGGLAALRQGVIEVAINHQPVQTLRLSELVRDAATLLRDVGDFMRLQPGDVLMLGSDCLDDGSRPLVVPGDRLVITTAGHAPLVQDFVLEAA